MSLLLEGEFFKDDFHSFGMADISQLRGFLA